MAKKANDKKDEEKYLLVLFAEDVRAFTAPETEGERDPPLSTT